MSEVHAGSGELRFEVFERAQFLLEQRPALLELGPRPYRRVEPGKVAAGHDKCCRGRSETGWRLRHGRWLGVRGYGQHDERPSKVLGKIATVAPVKETRGQLGREEGHRCSYSWRAKGGRSAAARPSPHKRAHNRTLIGTTGRWLPSTGQIRPERADDQRELPCGRLTTLPGTPRRHTHSCVWSRRERSQRPFPQPAFPQVKWGLSGQGRVEPPTFRFSGVLSPLRP